VIVVAFQVSRDSEITLNNLTLFAGGNSIGKSMVIQAILTFVQEGNSDSAVL
jgi:predicted ATPase